MKLSWEDIGGAAPAATATKMPMVAEVVEESPKDLIGKADNWLNEAIGMIRKVDEIVGVFMQLSGKGNIVDQAPPNGQGQISQAPAAGPPDQILTVLDKILKSEGDIPLQRFVDGIRNQEPWLLKYALEAKDET